jgi:putative RecB family exonuclease
LVNALTTVKPATRHISFSSISTYMNCPLKYFFRYIAGLPEETIASSLLFGTSAHAAFQFHFEQLLATGKAPPLDVLLEVFWDAWHEHDHQEILFGKGENESTIGSLADRVLRAFQRSAIAEPRGKIIAVEEELRGMLMPGLPELHARLDLVVEHDEAVEITDLKTTRAAWNDDQVMRSGDQLLLYAELAKHLTGGKPLRLSFAVLTKTKVPDVLIHPVTHDPQQVERTKRVVEKVWRAIEGGHFYPAPSAMICATCPYKKPCQRWTG